MDERGFGPPPPPYLCEQERLSYIEKWGGGEEVMGDRSRQDPDWKGNLYAGVTTLRCCQSVATQLPFLSPGYQAGLAGKGGRAGQGEEKQPFKVKMPDRFTLILTSAACMGFPDCSLTHPCASEKRDPSGI